MSFHRAYRPQSVLLILLLAFALVGLGFAPTATAALAPAVSMPVMSSGASATSPDCKGRGHCDTMTVACPAAVCAGIIAILTVCADAATNPTKCFVALAESEGRSIVVPPDIGPPRALPLA